MMMTMGYFPRFNFIARAPPGNQEYQAKTMTLLPFNPENIWDNTGIYNTFFKL